MSVLVYELSSGIPDRIVACSAGMEGLQGGPGEGVLITETELEETHCYYVDVSGQSPVLRTRSELTVVSAIDGLRVLLEGIPAGARLQVDEFHVVTDGSTMEVEFDLPGTYTIELSGLVEYLDETLEVTVG